jgi:NADPH:quinone reductase-like Zn-dependent oxidoreductase
MLRRGALAGDSRHRQFDWKLRSGAAKRITSLQFPAVLGRDVSGEVVETGPGVTAFRLHDKV